MKAKREKGKAKPADNEAAPPAGKKGAGDEKVSETDEKAPEAAEEAPEGEEKKDVKATKAAKATKTKKAKKVMKAVEAPIEEAALIEDPAGEAEGADPVAEKASDPNDQKDKKDVAAAAAEAEPKDPKDETAPPDEADAAESGTKDTKDEADAAEPGTKDTKDEAATPDQDAGPGEAGKKGLKGKLQWFSHWSQRQRLLAGVAAAMVVVVTVLLLVVNFAPEAAPIVPVGTDGAGEAATSLEDDADYDPEEFKLDKEKYVGTVLPETEDAGIEYAEETLFLGDSNTQRMMHYYDITGVTLQNGIGVVSMGINSFLSHSCVRFEGLAKTHTMAEAVGVIQPKRVVITFGTNNVGMNIDSFIGYYRSAIEAVNENYPYADIIIGGIFPVDQYRQNTSITMKGIDKMNAALAALAAETDCKFLNWGEAMVDEETGFSRFETTIQDGVHLTREGMDAIFTYFRTHSYITEDTRPKPLKAVPKILGVQPVLVTNDPAKASGPVDWSKDKSSSASAAAVGGVSVTFSAYDETNGKLGGGTVSGSSSFTVQAKPGEAISVSAAPKAGYEFVRWSASMGSTAGASGASLTFTVPGSAEAGTAITVTAVFKQTGGGAASSSSAAQEPSSSAAPPPASSSAPPPPPASSSAAQQQSSSSAAQQQESSSSSVPQVDPEIPPSQPDPPVGSQETGQENQDG